MSINKLKVKEKSGWIWSTTIHKDDQSLLFFSKTSHIPPTEQQMPLLKQQFIYDRKILYKLFSSPIKKENKKPIEAIKQNYVQNKSHIVK